MSCEELVAEERALLARLRSVAEELDAMVVRRLTGAEPLWITEGTPVTRALVDAIVAAARPGGRGILLVPPGIRR